MFGTQVPPLVPARTKMCQRRDNGYGRSRTRKERLWLEDVIDLADVVVPLHTASGHHHVLCAPLRRAITLRCAAPRHTALRSTLHSAPHHSALRATLRSVPHHTALCLYGVNCTACVQPLRGWEWMGAVRGGRMSISERCDAPQAQLTPYQRRSRAVW